MPLFQDPFNLQIPAKLIIVIHPGSQYLRIGRASDLNPHQMLHAIARKCLPGGKPRHDPFLPHQIMKTNKQVLQDMEDTRLQVSHTLQSCLQSDGQRRYATPPQQIAAFNRRSNPEIIEDMGGEWIESMSDFVVGDEVLMINPLLNNSIHFPIRRGELNLHNGPGGSLTAVLADLETIWSYAINNVLNISLDDLEHYRAVLVIPDIYNRQYLKEMSNLLLTKMGFGGCFLLQDHVAATFGAGLGYACVVDVGDQKTSVSCVEDGISHPNTRVRMEYGGADITQAFYWLLQKCAFPYKTCQIENKLDAMLLRQLKENFCHVNLDICGSQEKQFVVQQPETSVQKYTLQVGDECIVAPLGLFQPELFGITGKKAVTVQKNSVGDPEDPHDENYLRDTSYILGSEVCSSGEGVPCSSSILPDSVCLLVPSPPSAFPCQDMISSSLDATTSYRRTAKDSQEPSQSSLGESEVELNIMSSVGEDDIIVDAIDTLPSSNKEAEAKDFIVGPDQVLGLDQAILQSIERCPTDELKRKMYGCILVVGGGMKFEGSGTWLKNRISLQIPYLFRAEQMDIITCPKDMDPQITAWKGAAIMSCLESAHELWIHRREWEKMGVKILRERAPFMW